MSIEEMNWHTNEVIDIVDNDDSLSEIARRRRNDPARMEKSLKLAIEHWYDSNQISKESRVNWKEVDWQQVCSFFLDTT